MRDVAKFQIGDIVAIGLTLVVAGIGLAYGLEVIGDVKDDMYQDDCTGALQHWSTTKSSCYACPNATFNTWNETGLECTNSTGDGNVAATADVGQTTEVNASSDAISGVAKLPEKMETIATVVVAAIIIGILVTYLWGRVR